VYMAVETLLGAYRKDIVLVGSGPLGGDENGGLGGRRSWGCNSTPCRAFDSDNVSAGYSKTPKQQQWIRDLFVHPATSQSGDVAIPNSCAFVSLNLSYSNIKSLELEVPLPVHGTPFSTSTIREQAAYRRHAQPFL
jgi:hypothetical protein